MMAAAVTIPGAPPEVEEAYRRGWSVIPCRADKRPLLPTWAPYQQQAPHPRELAAWAKMQPPAWACVAGQVSGVVILDFDGEKGAATLARLALAPHVVTPSGGAHVYLTHPGRQLVKTLNAKSAKTWAAAWPGLDIRGDGGYALFCGATERGRYTWRRPMEPDDWRSIPADLAAALGFGAPAPTPAPAAPLPPLPTPAAAGLDLAGHIERMLREALARTGSQGRNNAGFWLSCQLRDADLAESAAADVLRRYAAAVPQVNQHGHPEAYTEREALASLAQAYRQPKREPARSRTAPPLRPAAAAAPPAAVTVTSPAPPPPPSAGPGRPRNKEPRECLRTDLGNAERLILRYGRNLRYCHPWKSWLVWDGRRWRQDDTAAAMRYAVAATKAIWDECKEAEDHDEQKALAKWALDSQASGRIRAMLDLARGFSEVSITPDLLDADPWALNVQNGTLDLRTGELKKHDRGALHTKLAPITWSPDADAPSWRAFVDQIMLQRADLVAYLRRAAGYACTGLVSEKAVFVLWGSGDNGKTTFLEVLKHTMGDYAGSIPIETLLQSRDRSGRDASPDIAALRGLRFVTTSEADDGARLNESRVKHLTGMARITARNLYAEPFEFDPTHKLFLDSNYRPNVRGQDKGIWTRLKLIPFELQLRDGQKDKGLMSRLNDEAAGILAWCVTGCLAWRLDGGLGEPDTVKHATAQYRAAMDTLQAFIEECTEPDETARTPAREMYQLYLAWAKDTGELTLSERVFAERLSDKGLAKHKTAAGMVYPGIRPTLAVSDRGGLRERRLSE